MFTATDGPLVRFLSSARPDPVIGRVIGAEHGALVIRTDDGHTHYRNPEHTTRLPSEVAALAGSHPSPTDAPAAA